MNSSNKKTRVGSRESRLAVLQAQIVIDAIKRYDPSIETELVTMKTSGDMELTKSLDSIGGKGLFVKELDRALLDRKVDITVHSFKDMPMEVNSALPIVAVSRREDPRDVLILPRGVQDSAKPYGCSSARRKLQLRTLFENSSVEPVRGNVLTRLEKLDRGEYSALVLAAAGIIRLGLKERISRYFSTEEMIPAACQGIIAVQARRGENTEFLRLFHSVDSWDASLAERKFVNTLDGGCSSPVAAYAEISGNEMKLYGLFVNENMEIRKGLICGDRADAEKLGFELAKKLRAGRGLI
jgi:hydroxymethylbilane synthase